MAQFRATMRGQRGEASRLGSKKSGLVARVDGWSRGIRVEAVHENGKDMFRVYVTGGSGPDGGEFLGFAIRGDVPLCYGCATYGAYGPPHDASPLCRSGRHPHCTCDTCF